MNETFAEINTKNLIFNYTKIRKKTKTKVLAVVKADAYGHGMRECVKSLEGLSDSPEYYGVALLEEAIELRSSKITNKPILCFSPIDLNELDVYWKKKIIPTITSEQSIDKLLKVKLKSKLIVHVKINTGMNRLGIKYSTAIKYIQKLKRNSQIVIDGIYTHFATSDEKNKDFANTQLKRFVDIIHNLKKTNIDFGLAHAANSGAILDMNDSYLDMVRPGISLYGYYPSLETSESIQLKPVMALKSKISNIMEIEKGETVGYGRHYKAQKRTRIGTVPIGYADGLQRALSNRISVMANNKLVKQLGRVSMDRISVELDNNSKVGAEIIVIGKKGKLEITAWDWSNKLNTIPYEITCNISKRVKRKYIT